MRRVNRLLPTACPFLYNPLHCFRRAIPATAERELEALSREVQPAFAMSMELKATVPQLQARAAVAETRCRELEALRSQQRDEMASKMNSAKAAASARLSARVMPIMLSDALQQLRSDEVGS